MRQASLDEVPIICFKDVQAGVEQAALRDDDNIETWRHLIPTENLSYQSFGSVSDHRAAQFLRGGDSEAARSGSSVTSKDEYRAEPSVDSRAPFVNPLKIRPSTDPFCGAKSRRR